MNIERLDFDREYEYHLTDILLEGDYSHCGNCSHYRVNDDDSFRWSGLPLCKLLLENQLSWEEATVNARRGLCRLWDSKEGETK